MGGKFSAAKGRCSCFLVCQSARESANYKLLASNLPVRGGGTHVAMLTHVKVITISVGCIFWEGVLKDKVCLCTFCTLWTTSFNAEQKVAKPVWPHRSNLSWLVLGNNSSTVKNVKQHFIEHLIIVQCTVTHQRFIGAINFIKMTPLCIHIVTLQQPVPSALDPGDHSKIWGPEEREGRSLCRGWRPQLCRWAPLRPPSSWSWVNSWASLSCSYTGHSSPTGTHNRPFHDHINAVLKSIHDIGDRLST